MRMKVYNPLVVLVLLLYAHVGIIETNTIATPNIINNRLEISLDSGWKFMKLPSLNCSMSSFTIDMNGKQCFGLFKTSSTNAHDCLSACCQSDSCNVWQWCPNNSSCNDGNSCWIGSAALSACKSSSGWQSTARELPPVPGPECTEYCKPAYDDAPWRTLNVPHDYVVEGTFSPTKDRNHGYLPLGQAWYRRHISIPAEYSGRSIWIYFEGIYRSSVVWLNGVYLGTHPSGYTSFYYDITKIPLNYGTDKDNVLAIYVDPVHTEGWWYEGGGIYRHVWLNVADPLHVVPWGVYVPSVVTGEITDKGAGQVSSAALVNFETDVTNQYANMRVVTVKSDVQSLDGKSIGSVSTNVTISSQQTTKVMQIVTVGTVSLWSAQSPSLYQVVTSIILADTNTIVDSLTTRIGFRKVVFDVDQGLFVNNKPTKIQGVCNHQDFAGVGVAVPTRINKFRMQKLKTMGVNGWRMSHNPPNPEVLDLADEIGMMVMDEDRWFDDLPEHLEDAKRMILRDRNHPSIIMWSLCNEAGCMPDDPNGAVVGASFKSAIVSLDYTRPIVAAILWDWDGGTTHVLDVLGVNYNYGIYDAYHANHTYRPMFGSETASCTGARGIYVKNDTIAHLDIYNADSCMRGWTTAVTSRPFIAGGFVWTGFDYKGEPSPYDWPEINSNFGIFDIAGFPKDVFYYYQSWWTNQQVLHVFPHWNWRGRENQKIDVWAYSNAAFVELFLNSKSLGKQEVPFLGRTGWSVAYAPGTLQAISYDKNGNTIKKDTVVTTGSAAAIVLSVDTEMPIQADGVDVALIAATIVDSAGNLVPDADRLVTFTVSGEGTIAGVGNGDPSCHEPDKANTRTTFIGLARAVAQSSKLSGSGFTVTATAPGLTPGKVFVQTH